MAVWRLIKSLPTSGFNNMQLDTQFFDDYENGNELSTLRIYAWNPPCISVGYSQDIEQNIDIYKTFDYGWEIVKRPTGGGIVFHNQSEVSYSVITNLDSLPSGLAASYVKISEAIIAGLQRIGVNAQIQQVKTKVDRPDLCFSYPSEYEIVVDGRKLVGSAQKRGKRALLQQGSIFMHHDFENVLEVLKNPVDKDFYSKYAVSVEEILKREVSFEEAADALTEGVQEKLGIQFNDK